MEVSCTKYLVERMLIRLDYDGSVVYSQQSRHVCLERGSARLLIILVSSNEKA